MEIALSECRTGDIIQFKDRTQAKCKGLTQSGFIRVLHNEMIVYYDRVSGDAAVYPRIRPPKISKIIRKEPEAIRNEQPTQLGFIQRMIESGTHVYSTDNAIVRLGGSLSDIINW